MQETGNYGILAAEQSAGEGADKEGERLSLIHICTEQSGEVPKMPGEDGTEDGGAAKENADRCV